MSAECINNMLKLYRNKRDSLQREYGLAETTIEQREKIALEMASVQGFVDTMKREIAKLKKKNKKK